MSQSVPSALGPQPKCRLGTRAQGYTTQGYKRTPHKSTGSQEYTTLHKGTPHMSTPHKGTPHKARKHKGTSLQTTGCGFWHRRTPFQLFIISWASIYQSVALHFYKTAYWQNQCLLLDTNYCTLYIGQPMYTTVLCVGRATSSVAGQQSCLSSSCSVVHCLLFKCKQQDQSRLFRNVLCLILS